MASCLAGKENPGVNSWMDFSTWSASSHYILNQLHQSGCDYPEYQMYEAFLLYMENHHEEARVLLESYQDKSYTRDDLEFAGIYLYLCTLTGLYKDKVHALSRIRNFYMQKSDSFPLLWILLKLDPAYKETPSKALFVLEEQFWQGLQESVPLSGSMEDHLQGHDSSSQAEQLLGTGIPLRGKKKPSYRGAGNASCISFWV